MSVIKIVGVTALSLCAFAACKLYALKFKRQMMLCENFLSFLNFAKSELRFSSKTVLEICRAYCAINEHALPFLENCTEPVSESIREALKAEKCLSDKQKRLMTAFFAQFGLADEEGSMACIENYYYLFSSEFNSTGAECLKRIQLMNKLSFFAAAATAIIFI